MRSSKVALFLFSLLLVTTFALDTRAQAVYGSIAGTVTDSSGAVVPDATVTIRSVERNTSDTVQTNDSGFYIKDRLLPGIYEVKVEKGGYKQSILASVTVNLDTQSSADVALETGQVTETVTIVTGEGQLLKTDRADVATTFDSKQVTDLPILDRNFTRFILLTPGTQQQLWQHAASENPQGSIQTVVNGQHFSGTGYQLDGTENRDPILGIIVINPNFESIGETKITTQNYDAEFGQAIAGVVSVQTRSGTNDLHGSLFAFRQNDVLQARNPFTQFRPDPVTGKLLPDLLKNQFGGSVGGRIIRDKLFFFGDYQGTRSKVGGTRLLTVPTLLARTGNFSEYGRNIFDPGTGANIAPGSRVQFAGNVIPAGRLSTQALNVLALIPRPNSPGRENGTRDNFAASGSEVFDNDTFDIRMDGRLTKNLNMFGRYSFADYKRDGPTAFGEGGGPELVSLGGTSKVRNQSLALGLDYVLTPTSVLDARFGWFKYKVNVLPFDFGTTPATAAGIPGLNLDDFSSGLFGGFVEGEFGFNFGSGLGVNRCNCPLDEEESQYQVVSNLTTTFGNHTAKFGVDFRRAFNLRVPSDTHRSGELSFSPDRTASAAGGTGLGFATFLLGDVTNFGRYVGTSLDAKERQWRHFYYGQDTWRVTQKLTINYGLRLDIINPQTINKPGNGGFLDLDTGEILTAGVGDTDLAGNVENKLNWAPRLAAAYQLTDKTVVRVGYGRSYDIGVFGSVFGHSVTQNLPVLAIQRNSAPGGSGDRVFNLAQGPAAFTAFFGLNAPPNQGGTPNATLPASGRFFLPDGVTTFALPKKQRLPALDAYNVTVQHQLTPTISIEAAYVGNKGTHVFAGGGPDYNPNQATLEGFLQGVPFRNRQPFFNRFGWTQSLRYFCNCADNRYDSLQTKITKRFSEGYSFMAHYTLQKAQNNDGDQFDFNRELNRGRQDFDRTHNFVLTNLFELPIGRGKRFLGDTSRGLNYLVGGWQFNSTTTMQSGLPFNVNYNRSGTTEGDTGPSRPDLTGDPQTGGPRTQFYNPNAFGRPAPGTFGNLKRNSLSGPGYWRTDASLFKKFIFSETKELEFRIESVNVFNHVNLGQPADFIGNPANPDPNAGVISSTAFFGADPQRNFQFALKFKF
jgi:carboxypeptidase family protein/TonB-dependent receptor-like protein